MGDLADKAKPVLEIQPAGHRWSKLVKNPQAVFSQLHTNPL
jgi:hypothetical protein